VIISARRLHNTDCGGGGLIWPMGAPPGHLNVTSFDCRWGRVSLLAAELQLYAVIPLLEVLINFFSVANLISLV
jgi:hypothetical protein